MKYLIALICLLFSTQAFAETAYDRVLRTGEIRCGYGIYAPWIEKDLKTGEMKGVMAELADVLAKRLDIKLVWGEETGWGNLPTSLHNGRVDLSCSTLWNDPRRGKLVAFSDVVFYQPIYAYARADDTRFTGKLEEINAENIAISMIDGGYSASVADRLFPKAKHNSLAQMSNWSEAILNVATGKADVIFSDDMFIGDFNANNEKKLKKISLAEPVAHFGNSFAVNINEPALKEMISNTVKYMHQTGEIEALTADFRVKYPGVMLLPKKTYQSE
jgi:ABC-type amino acid transport substrate-binding protein